jgi:L-ectoine synthase
MIVRTLADIGNDPLRDVAGEGWRSRRLLLAGDKMGFSLHDTLIPAGTALSLWYRNHLEAVYCIAGKGSVTAEADGVPHAIEPGTLYALDQNDKHVLQAEEELRLVCVFNPPCVGREAHDETGAYPLPAADET